MLPPVIIMVVHLVVSEGLPVARGRLALLALTCVAVTCDQHHGVNILHGKET